jgi:hypothetical protein
MKQHKILPASTMHKLSAAEQVELEMIFEAMGNVIEEEKLRAMRDAALEGSLMQVIFFINYYYDVIMRISHQYFASFGTLASKKRRIDVIEATACKRSSPTYGEPGCLSGSPHMS